MKVASGHKIVCLRLCILLGLDIFQFLLFTNVFFFTQEDTFLENMELPKSEIINLYAENTYIPFLMGFLNVTLQKCYVGSYYLYSPITQTNVNISDSSINTIFSKINETTSTTIEVYKSKVNSISLLNNNKRLHIDDTTIHQLGPYVNTHVYIHNSQIHLMENEGLYLIPHYSNMFWDVTIGHMRRFALSGTKASKIQLKNVTIDACDERCFGDLSDSEVAFEDVTINGDWFPSLSSYVNSEQIKKLLKIDDKNIDKYCHKPNLHDRYVSGSHYDCNLKKETEVLSQ